MKYFSLPYNCVPKLKYELKLNKNYLGCFGNPLFLVKLFSRRFWVKWKAGMFVFLWSCGFLARRVFDKMIFYFTKWCPLCFQEPSIQRLSAGAVQVVLRWKIVWSSACENSLLWENIQTVWNINAMLTPCWEIFENCYLNYHLRNVIITGLIPVFWRQIFDYWTSECI